VAVDFLNIDSLVGEDKKAAEPDQPATDRPQAQTETAEPVAQTKFSRALLGGVALSIVITVFTFDKAIGLGATLSEILLIGGLLLHARQHETIPARRNLVLLVPLAFFGVMLTIRSNIILTFLNFGAIFVALALWLDYFHIGNVLRTAVFSYPGKLVTASMNIGLQPVDEIGHARKWWSERKTNASGITPFLRGLFITLPVVAVFVLLFSSADNVFARIVGDALRGFIPSNPVLFFFQGWYLLIIAWLCVGALAYSVVERKAKNTGFSTPSLKQFFEDQEAPKTTISRPAYSLGFTETMMLLGSLCGVFALFVGIQFVYLFGGAANIANFSYADYARRGFAELLAVGVMTLALAFGIEKIAVRKSHRAENSFRILVTLLFGLTGVILASAYLRLHLYELAYGFTTLRLTVYVSIAWLAALLVGFLVSLYWHPLNLDVFGTVCLITVFGYIGTLNLLNPDAFVARENVDRGDIDPMYLASLSPEAAPTLIPLLDSPDYGTRQIIGAALQAKWGDFSANANFSDWRAFNGDRRAAYDALSGAEAKIKSVASEKRTLTADDFVGKLHYGQTVRDIVRQYGRPSYMYDYNWTNYQVIINYYIPGETRSVQQTVSIYVDTERGVQRACIANNCFLGGA